MNTHLAPIADTLERVRARIERADEVPTLDALAQFAQLSPSHLQRAFRRRYGMSPAEYHRARRFGQLKAALRDGAAVTDAVYEAGFGSGSRVYEHSDRLLGMTPASYRAGGAGAGREEWLDAVIARIASELGWSDADAPALPPLDVAATAFQWRVWNALTRIPAGETRSYGELAAAIGAPKAARAVGNACGNNRHALIVPCHRVVREDGTPGGWRWGVQRKRELLARERRGAKR